MIRVCLNTQTPPISPIRGAPRPGGVWRAGVDYNPNVGGVVPMMRALLKTSLGRWVAPHPRWIAMGAPGLPPEVRTDDGYILDTFLLEGPARAQYSDFKEAIWRSFHGPSTFRFPSETYPAFVHYSYLTAARLLEHLERYDLFYVNDFQQLLVGGLIGSAAPALLRWHIPVDLKGYPEPVRRFFLKAMEGFDAIVVSTRSGLEELIHSGFQGRAFQVYPYLDPAAQRMALSSEISTFRARFSLSERDPIVLSVARMDPVKRHDLLLAAFAQVRRRHPSARLVLAGGASFSTRTLGRRGVRSKAEAWEEELHREIRQRGLGESVVFTGTLTESELQAAYSAAQVFVHPAPWEGFGLVAIEAWCHKLPVVVSDGAGVSELIDDDVNGYTYPAGSVASMSQRISQLLSHPQEALRMGEVGSLSARRCFVGPASSRLHSIFERTIDLYERTGMRLLRSPGGIP